MAAELLALGPDPQRLYARVHRTLRRAHGFFGEC
jgi:hypothetical protein